MPPIAGLWYLLEYYMLVIFMKTQFSIGLEDSKPAGILNWIYGTNGSTGPKAATLTVELHSIDTMLIFNN